MNKKVLSREINTNCVNEEATTITWLLQDFYIKGVDFKTINNKHLKQLVSTFHEIKSSIKEMKKQYSLFDIKHRYRKSFRYYLKLYIYGLKENPVNNSLKNIATEYLRFVTKNGENLLNNTISFIGYILTKNNCKNVDIFLQLLD